MLLITLIICVYIKMISLLYTGSSVPVSETLLYYHSTY